MRMLFTYRCWESDHSADAHLWKRSGQYVEILREIRYPEVDEFDINGPMFEVRFPDGLVNQVWNDEISFTR